ncbi:hypothetical protein RMATCC62417_06360 [Rhizopus microsporus]|nr:hypothetical protein RMATCC62417_06360 [Rhizopus microsporus]CEI95968.1 hypothetical protein RMCBS344292_10142 [Rhizopus microsporus]
MSLKQILQPSQHYLEIAKQASITLKEPRKQLLILDLNGTLVSRVKGGGSMFVRPFSDQFFDYIFDHFTVMVWSSAQPHSVNFMCRMFGSHRSKLALIWDRTSFGLSIEEYSRKTATIKDLNKVWQRLEEFDATNTILLDDSSSKTVLQPFNVIHPTEFIHGSSSFRSSGECELVQIIDYLKVLRYQSNVANYIMNHPFKSIFNHQLNSFKVLHFIKSEKDGYEVDFNYVKPANQHIRF